MFFKYLSFYKTTYCLDIIHLYVNYKLQPFIITVLNNSNTFMYIDFNIIINHGIHHKI